MRRKHGTLVPSTAKTCAVVSKSFEKTPAVPMTPSPNRRSTVRHGDVQDLAALVGSQFEALGSPIAAGDAVASGFLCLRQIRPGLLVHVSETRHRRPLSTRLVKNSGLNISVVLAGGWRGTLAGRSLSCGGSSPEAAFFALAEPEPWIKQVEADDYARMINVMVSPEWLGVDEREGETDKAASIKHLGLQHLAQSKWRPSARLLQLAEQVLTFPEKSSFIRDLFVESRAIDMTIEALSRLALDPSARSSATLRPADVRRMHHARDLIEAGAATNLSLTALAREVGVSLRTLHRQFRLVHSISPAALISNCRLDHARMLLAREGVSVAQAAHRAGYGNAANFATAFKRRFGFSPKYVRTRC